MSDAELAPEVQRLISETVSSMDHVEALFHLYQLAEVTKPGLAGAAHLDVERLDSVLRDLDDGGLIAQTREFFRITDDPRNRAAVESFAEAYNTRPVTLIRAVRSRITPLSTFADAFRRRGDG